MKEFTKSDMRETVEQETYQLDDLINPSDVNEDYEEWSNIPKEEIDEEIHQSIEVIGSEIAYRHELKGALFDRTLTLFKRDMMRAPMDDLSFDDKKAAVKAGYWPYQMDRWEVLEILHEEITTKEDLPIGYYQDAYDEMSSMLFEAMKPSDYTGE